MPANKHSTEANGYYIPPQFLPDIVRTASVDNHFYHISLPRYFFSFYILSQHKTAGNTVQSGKGILFLIIMEWGMG